jgi:hypothetical protein
MSITNRFMGLAFAGAIALSGCAGAQQAARQPQRLNMQPDIEAETPVQRCQRERRTRVQDCIIESIVTQCRTRRAGDEPAVQACVDEGLRQSLVYGETRSSTVTVGQGDELFSFRVGNSAMMDVGRLEASAVDQSGVTFVFNIERFAPTVPAEKIQITNDQVRLNFDGSRSGGWDRVAITEVRVLSAAAAGDGRATVTVETEDPRVLLRPSGANPSR